MTMSMHGSLCRRRMKGNRDMSDTFEIIEEVGIIGRKPNGNVKKLVLIRWYKNPPQYNIREFSEEGKALKGIALTKEELRNLFLILPGVIEGN